MKFRLGFYWMWLQSIVSVAQTQNAQPEESQRYPIILSSRWFHPDSPKDTLSTLEMVNKYKPDRIDWMYCMNPEQLAQLRKRKIPYSLAINPQIPDSAGYTVRGRVVDRNEKKLVAPWMIQWEQKNSNWGCVNSPEFKKLFYEQSRKIIDLEAYGIFVDDARFNDHAVDWGGCFCQYCMEGFKEYIRKKDDSIEETFDYKAFLRKKGPSSADSRIKEDLLHEKFKTFQKESVIFFLKCWKKDMLDYAKRPLTFLTNNYGGEWTEIYKLFDVGISEIAENNYNERKVKKSVTLARKLSKKQFFTLSSGNEIDQLRILFQTYSIGSGLVIPWDVMIQSKSKHTVSRYFGDEELYKPIYTYLKDANQGKKGKSKIKQTKDLANHKIKVLTKNIDTKILMFTNSNKTLVQVRVQGSIEKNKIWISTAKNYSLKAIKIIYPKPTLPQTIDGESIIEFDGNLAILEIQTNSRP